VTGGATYTGDDETMTDNAMNGLFSLGCEMACPDPACAVIQEQTTVVLEGATIEANQADGVFAGCDASVELRRSTVARSRNVGARVAETFVFDPDHRSSGPSALRAEKTVFKGNGTWGVISRGASRLHLGTADHQGRNSFLENASGSIFDNSPNPVQAQGNWFGTTDAASIAASIRDCADDPALGCVQYVPFLKKAPFRQVDAPTFSPVGGTYATDQAVTLRCSTPGSTVHYTTDGTTPTERSAAYTAPIPVAGIGTSLTLRAVATKKGMLDSDVATATYTIKALADYAFIPLSGTPNDVVHDAAHGRAYVSNRTLNRIDIVNVQTREVEASIPVGGSPRGLAIAPDGHTLLTTLFDKWQMSVIDLDSRSQVSLIDLPAPAYGCWCGPLRVDFDAAGTCIWRDGTEAHAFGNAYILDLGTGTSTPLVPTEAEMLRYAPSFDRSKFLLMFNWGRASVWTSASQSASAPVSIPGFSGDWWNWMNQGAINDSGAIILLSTYGATKAYDASFNHLGSTADMAWATFGPWSHLALVVPGSDEIASDTVSLVDFGSIRTIDSLVLPERVGYEAYNFGGQRIFLAADAKQLFLVGQTGLYVIDTSAVAE
jgi:YVTN family beta-propeller protein